MRAVWDPDKAKANLEKHGVRFSDAELVLYDPYAVTVEDSVAQGEQRHLSVGLDAVGRILVVVYTYRGENVRLISARPATRRERQQYEEGIRF
ncbi:MAG TPA: BrnT family toxin [Thermoanaerobaculia bacterium]|nr:BrnT family toxin [Thermoanaerobaculia bacterium]